MLTVELDKEKGPQVIYFANHHCSKVSLKFAVQIRVPQGKELPAFLQLFGGGMIVYVEQ